jgi:hypothetical protein
MDEFSFYPCQWILGTAYRLDALSMNYVFSGDFSGQLFTP